MIESTHPRISRLSHCVVARRLATAVWLLLGCGLLLGCDLDMRQQPRYGPQARSDFFADQAAARPRVADTVARGEQDLDLHLHTGRVSGRFAESFPFTVTLQTLQRGQERYAIFCAPCHGLTGDGKGIVAEYGMRTPDSFHTQALRDQPPGYYFSLISDGTRVMPSYGARIRPEDRWAIVAYIRALQLSQRADPSQVPAEELPALDATEADRP